MMRKTFYYPAQSYNVPEIIKIPPIYSVVALPASLSKHSYGILSSGNRTHSSHFCQPLRKATAFVSNWLINYEMPQVQAAGRRQRWRHPPQRPGTRHRAPAKLRQSQEGRGLARPPSARGAGSGGRAVAGGTEPRGGTAGKGDPAAGAGGVSVTQRPSRRGRRGVCHPGTQLPGQEGCLSPRDPVAGAGGVSVTQ